MNKPLLVATLSVTSLAAGVAHSAPIKTNCARGEDARVIEVVQPGVVGQSCDVRYTRGGSNVSVPYHADNSDSFCNQKATEMVKRLTLSGFACSTSAPALRAQAAPASQSPAADYVVEVQRQAVEPQLASASEPIPLGEPVGVSPIEEVVQDSAASSVEVLEDEMSKILAQPALHQDADRESPPGAPAQLLAQQTETPASRPQPSPVGRLVGAAPETPRPATTVTQASLAIQESNVAEQPLTKSPPAEKKEALTSPAAAGLRTPADVVRATLMVQAAAWNEGDLDGFMNGYWKNDELKFVSGGTVTKGWDATLKKYRERYAGASGLGQLGFEKLDVKLVTDDVAVVTGRFNLNNSGSNSSGLFSLVMRRDNGAWRIVHDHTSADPKPATSQ